MVSHSTNFSTLMIILLIGRQPGIDVRIPTPINELFNYESIAVQILLLDVYTWN